MQGASLDVKGNVFKFSYALKIKNK